MADTKAARPYGDVTYADPKNGKYPVDTEEHARAAWAYINKAENAAKYPLNGVTLSEVKDRIRAACKKFGIDISGDSSSRAESLAPFYRSYPLEDISIRAGGDGRTVTAYAAVFGVETEIHDQDGDYTEELDPAVFNRAISDAAPQGSRAGWRIGCFYNHGMTLYGTPSERHAMPVGVPLEVKADDRGLYTVTRYNKSALADEILDNIRDGSLPGYSFSGMFRRSNPLIPRGGFRPDRYGNLPKVRRTESTLREYGPTPFPAYAGAAITGMRSDMLLGAMAADPDLGIRMLSMLRDGAPQDSPPPSGAPAPGLAAEDSPPGRSGRSVREQITANRAALLQRQHRS
jgi:HK97 family phage prohead protease